MKKRRTRTRENKQLDKQTIYHSFHHHFDANNAHSKGHEATQTCNSKHLEKQQHILL